MKITILADLPPDALVGLTSDQPAGSHPSWIPQMIESFSGEKELDLHWITLSKRVKRCTILENHSQSIHVLPRQSKLVGALTAYRSDRSKIGKVIRSLDPDIVNAWGTEDAYALAACDADCPVVISMLGLLQHYNRVTDIGRFYRLQAIYERSVLAKTKYLTVESDWSIRVMREYAPHAQISRAECGVSPDYFDVQWAPDPSKPRALFVGVLNERKGIADAVSAFAAREMQDYELHVCGSGPQEKPLKANPPPNVIWRGPLSKAELLLEMQSAWCLVLPTRADNSPNVVKEARVVGMPVITTPHGGQSNHIHHGKNGYLFEPGDVPALTDSLARIFADLDHCKSLGAYRHAEQRDSFRPENNAKALLTLFRQILNP